MLKEIRLYGKLAKFIGQRVLHADVATAAEAVRFLLANWPEVEQHMANQHYKVCLDDAALDENELAHPIGQAVIKIIPVVAGAGFWKTLGKIFAGIGLIALAFFAPIIAGAIASSLSASALATLVSILPTVQAALYGIGVATALGGVASLLTPVPSMGSYDGSTSADDPKNKSYSFSGIQNTSRQGSPCPIVFGEALVGSIVISAGIDTVQVNA
jgi:predicted phage tail protein